jgi:hypothetical protein
MSGSNEIRYREKQKIVNRRLIEEFPGLLSAGATRNLLTDDIIVIEAVTKVKELVVIEKVEKVEDRKIYFSLNKVDAPFLSIFNLLDFQADVFIHFEGQIKVAVIKISHQGSGEKLRTSILDAIPQNCRINSLIIAGLKVDAPDIIFRDIIIYRDKKNNLDAVLKNFSENNFRPPTRNYLRE